MIIKGTITVKELRMYIGMLECEWIYQQRVIERQEKEIEFLIRANESLQLSIPDPYPEETAKRKGLFTNGN